MTAKYAVGQKVMVRSDLIVGVIYGFFFSEGMSKLIGQTVTIKEVISNSRIPYYKIEEGDCFWTDDMLVEPKPVEPKLPQRIIDIERATKLEIYVEKFIVNDPATILFYRVPVFDENGLFLEWSDTKKIVAKCNKEIGDTFDVGKGVKVAMLKAYRKEIDKMMRKY